MKDFEQLKEECRKALDGVAKSSSGYGKLYVHPEGKVWFTTWDGDEDDYVSEIRNRLYEVAGKENVTIEAEMGPKYDQSYNEEDWEEVKLKYATASLLSRLHRVAAELESVSLHDEASIIHDVFVRVAETENLLEHKDVIEAEMTLEDALNNYDSDTYRVDPKGNWNPEEWITIAEFMESLPEDALSAPAAIDANHIAFDLPDVGFQVVNLVPRSEWESPDDTKAEDNTRFFTSKELLDFGKDFESQNEDQDFRKQLQNLINSLSKENGSDTPDFILAEYLDDCLKAFDKAVSRREDLSGDEDAVTFVSDELAKAASVADKQQRYALADVIDGLNARFSKNHGGLDDWFENEKWRDLRRPKKDGGYEECGRGDTNKGKKPVCVPANKAKNLSEKERKERLKQKSRKEKEPGDGKKPKTTTYTDGAGGKSNIS